MSAEGITTIVPVYNGATFLAEAVASIRSQSAPPDQIVIVDDGSTDGSADLAHRLGQDLCVVQHPRNQGVAAALNSGLAAADGELLTFLDVDDVWPPDAIETHLAALQPDIDVVIGHMQRMVLDARESERRFVSWGEPLPAWAVGTSLIRRRAFDRIGTFDTSLAHGSDWDWYMRAREQGVPILTHSRVVLYYRRHGENMTEDPIGYRYTLEMIRKSLQRRRQQSGGDAGPLPDVPSR